MADRAVVVGAGSFGTAVAVLLARAGARTALDRKSTRLNSSHLVISYAVFCLKKKKSTTNRLGYPSLETLTSWTCTSLLSVLIVAWMASGRLTLRGHDDVRDAYSAWEYAHPH